MSADFLVGQGHANLLRSRKNGNIDLDHYHGNFISSNSHWWLFPILFIKFHQAQWTTTNFEWKMKHRTITADDRVHPLTIRLVLLTSARTIPRRTRKQKMYPPEWHQRVRRLKKGDPRRNRIHRAWTKARSLWRTEKWYTKRTKTASKRRKLIENCLEPAFILREQTWPLETLLVPSWRHRQHLKILHRY